MRLMRGGDAPRSACRIAAVWFPAHAPQMASPIETCPWSSLDPGTVHFCEERLCAWVVEPSNAWSSMAYVVIGV
jgi:hypothetical protein